MTLLEQLDAVLPNWRREYYNDPIAAATDLGLIDEADLDRDVQALDFNDERANWRRLSEADSDE